MKKSAKKGKAKGVKAAAKSLKSIKKPALKAKAKVISAKPLKKPSKELKGRAESDSVKSKEKAQSAGGKNKGASPLATGKFSTEKGAAGSKGKIDKKAQIIAELVAAQKVEAEIVLTNAEGKEYCRVHDCDNEATTDGHCRFHYIALWKRNRIKAKILQGGKLDKYIEDLTAKYPDKYLEMLRKDLASEKDFNLIVAEMDVEDAGEEAEGEEDTSRFIEEVRGGMPTPDDDEGSF